MCFTLQRQGPFLVCPSVAFFLLTFLSYHNCPCWNCICGSYGYSVALPSPAWTPLSLYHLRWTGTASERLGHQWGLPLPGHPGTAPNAYSKAATFRLWPFPATYTTDHLSPGLNNPVLQPSISAKMAYRPWNTLLRNNALDHTLQQ